MIVRANKHHIEPIVRIHLASFPDSFLTKLGPSMLTVIYEEMSKPPLGFCWVYIQNGQVLGFLSGSYIPSGRFYNRIFRKRIWPLGLALMTKVIRSPKILLDLGRRVPNVFGNRKPPREEFVSSPPTGKVAHILSIASSPAFQGQGVGTSLLRAAVDNLQVEGHDYVHISFLADNVAAKRLYENAEFVPYKHSQSADGVASLHYQLNLKKN
jgi:ribosomal protein S18 acetylase RimI-like enzyme